MRTRLSIIAIAIALGGVRPSGAINGPAPSVDDLLTAIDFAPQASDLDAAMAAPLDDLITLIGDPSVDQGERLRAIRALAQYPSDPARAELGVLVDELAAARAGTQLLQLRAAIEALGDIGGVDAVPVITPFLNAEESLDLRATAARALGTIGAQSAVSPLKSRQVIEQSPEVRVAITEALRKILGGG